MTCEPGSDDDGIDDSVNELSVDNEVDWTVIVSWILASACSCAAAGDVCMGAMVLLIAPWFVSSRCGGGAGLKKLLIEPFLPAVLFPDLRSFPDISKGSGVDQDQAWYSLF